MQRIGVRISAALVVVGVSLACGGLPRTGPATEPVSPEPDVPVDPAADVWKPTPHPVEVGACLAPAFAEGRGEFADPDESPFRTVECSKPHRQEVTGTVPIPSGTKGSELEALADAECARVFEEVVGRAPGESRSDVAWYPTASDIVCTALRHEDFTGSVSEN